MSTRPASAPPAETYIGDGVYASFNGVAIRLRAPRLEALGDASVEVNNEVFLEPQVYAELVRFAAGVFNPEGES
jgi:hypothetical protein